MKFFFKVFRNFFFKYLIWLIIITTGSILTYMILDFSKTIKSIVKDRIAQTIERTETELDNFFVPVVNQLMITRDWGESNLFRQLNPEKLNPVFTPVLKRFRQMSSMLIANSKGCEYMLLEMGDGVWINRKTTQDSASQLKEVLKYEWNYKTIDSLISKKLWVEKKDYDPRVRPWYKVAISNSNINEPAWTDPYTFATTKDPGITTSARWLGKDSLIHVVAYDLMLTDISRYTTTLHPSKNGQTFILTSDWKLIGLPSSEKYKSIDSLKASVLKTAKELNFEEILKCVDHYQNTKNEKAFNFKAEHDQWWGQLIKYQLNSKVFLYIGVVIPEKDVVAEMKSTKNTIIIGFLLVIIVTIVLVYNFQQKRKANVLLKQQNEEILQQKEEIETQNEHILQQKEEIEAQRDEIEAQRDEVMKNRDFIAEQNREITDSIKYAKRIQRAILPVEEYRYKLLNKHFILFKPLNIVSGDFYWMTLLEGKTIVTVADCTGHGVPGAFMSMLGAAFLNEIVNKEYITHPGVILRRLRKQVIKALQQTGSSGEQKDGMDISMCSIDMETLDIQFAGANNPLYLIRDKKSPAPDIDPEVIKTLETEDKILYEIKPDKMPIAIYEKMDRFKTHDFKLLEGDSLYLFSDGFADQFGGEKGKKFMYKNFKLLLLKIQDKTMEEQQTILDQTIEAWKSHIDPLHNTPYDQIDDICVVGFRI